MGDFDTFRERVKAEAQKAVDEELGRGPDGSGGGDGTLGTAEIVSRGWDMSEYNSFFADCRQDGFSAAECGEMWSESKDSGAADVGSSPEPVGGDDAPDVDMADVVLLKEGSESSDLAAQYLSPKIMDEEVGVATVDSDEGQQILEHLDDVPPVPEHVRVTEDEVEVGDIESLLQDAVVGV